MENLTADFSQVIKVNITVTRQVDTMSTLSTCNPSVTMRKHQTRPMVGGRPTEHLPSAQNCPGRQTQGQSQKLHTQRSPNDN